MRFPKVGCGIEVVGMRLFLARLMLPRMGRYRFCIVDMRP
jgi:hypothetical protein